MKKGMVATILVVSLSSILMASGYKDCKDQHKEYAKKGMFYNKHYKDYAKHGKFSHRSSMHRDMFLKTIMSLDLTKEQRVKIRDIIKNSMKNSYKKGSKRSSMISIFSADGFDKAKFIDMMKAKSAMMIEKKLICMRAYLKYSTNSKEKIL